MDPRAALSLLVLLLTYLGLALGGLPGYRMNRAGVALVGASLLLLLGTLDLEAAWEALDASTLVFLFGVMVLNAQLSYAGFFALAAQGAPGPKPFGPFGPPHLRDRGAFRPLPQRHHGPG
jgi:Na+/H+ antiporter NhaD/arsenite permease-like protein